MFRGVVVALVVLSCAVAHAAPAAFESMTYEAPRGWKVTSTSSGVQMQIIDEKAGAFALVAITPSIASQGSLDKDFDAAWSTGVAPTFKITGKPEMVPGESENGWSSKGGTATGEANGIAAVIILVTLTGHGRAMNIIIAVNNDKHQAAVQGFMDSVKMAVPKTQAPRVQAPTTPAPTAPSTPSSAKNGSGSTSTTFDDGWTSTLDENWVRVTRPGVTVFLHYGVSLDDNSRRDPTSSLWNLLVAPRYSNVKNYNAPTHSQVHFPYYEATAEATDRNGANAFVVMRLSINGGIAKAIEIAASSRQAYEKQFADRDAVLAIANANRFSVGNEVAGTWSSFTGASVDMYYVATGSYAGKNVAALSDRFTFGSGGAYTSEHKGSGGQTVFQEKYTGTWSVTSPWEITVKRSDGKVTVYTAHYEAVRGGRLLRLSDKKYSSMSYALARAK
jgi:hypothetical protein